MMRWIVGLPRRRAAVAQEVREIAPDIPVRRGGSSNEAGIEGVAQELLGGDYVPIKAADGQYGIRGTQWMWFLVKSDLADKASPWHVNANAGFVEHEIHDL